jgi:hypothetical protein
MTADRIEYQKALDEALNARASWLEKTEFPKFKEEFRIFQTAFGVLYKLLIQKKLIHEDPYKQEAKMGEITTPDPIIPDGDKMEQLTISLSAYDNQLDYLVNFFQFSIDFFTLENIKRILSLIKYIDWARFTSNTQSPTTKALVDTVNTARSTGDPLTVSAIGESLEKLSKGTGAIIAYLREATTFNREAYKLELRQTITETMNDVTLDGIRKKFAATMGGRPFYPDLAEELIKEDYSPGGKQLRDEILKRLAVPETKPKTAAATISFKETLLNGLLVAGSISTTLNDIAPRLDENNLVFQDRRQTFFEKLKNIFRQMLHRRPDPVMYDIEYIDSAKGTTVKETINFNVFRAEMDKKARFLMSLSSRGGVTSRLEAMDEKQLLGMLERSIREAQGLHKILTGLDELFKTEAPRENRDKIRGIKPELASIKNAIIRANQKRHEYSAQLEEKEQLKRLGVNLNA